MYPGGGALGPSLLPLLLEKMETEEEDGDENDDLSRLTILSAGMEGAPLSVVLLVEISWVAMLVLVLAAGSKTSASSLPLSSISPPRIFISVARLRSKPGKVIVERDDDDNGAMMRR